MKRFFYLIIVALLSASSLKAQTTEGKDFWVTFGRIGNMSMTPTVVNNFDFRIRIIGGNAPTDIKIYFTHLDTSIDYNMLPYEIYNYNLNNTEKQAVYNSETGITNFSIRITTTNPVSVFAFEKYGNNYSDATNIAPVTALGTEYYAISYNPVNSFDLDTYAVIATEDNTKIYHNGDSLATLNAGQVYCRNSSTDMTGTYITASNSVAFFATCSMTQVPSGMGTTLFQQLNHVYTWGKSFFVPVAVCEKNHVRIVASENNTTITQTGGTIFTNKGGQPTLNNLQVGQFVELEIFESNNGCYISADKPVGVCSYISSSGGCFYIAKASQVWIPAIDQSIPKVLMAPFEHTIYNHHHALVITPTITKDSTKVSIGGYPPVPLSGGSWHDHTAMGGMSFYDFPLTDHSAPYTFSNQAKIIVLGCGFGSLGAPVGYYYLAGSGMRDLDAAFYANDIHFQELKDTAFCSGAVEFRAEIEGELHPDAGRLKWYVDGVEEVLAQDHLEWNKYFPAGAYEITMKVHYETGETASKTATLQIAACNYSAAFYANDVYYADLADTLFCVKDITVTTTIEGVEAMTSLKWYINDVLIPALEGEQTWTHTFKANNYIVKMEITFNNGETQTYEGALSIGSIINIAPITPDGGDTNINGGTPNTGGCFKVGTKIYFNAVPK